jgi:hypothetical protein
MPADTEKTMKKLHFEEISHYNIIYFFFDVKINIIMFQFSYYSHTKKKTLLVLLKQISM